VTAKPVRRTGKVDIHEFDVDGQTMSTADATMAARVRAFEGLAATVTYTVTTKGGFMIGDIAPTTVSAELPADEVFG
jgi:hypothetical protein